MLSPVTEHPQVSKIKCRASPSACQTMFSRGFNTWPQRKRPDRLNCDFVQEGPQARQLYDHTTLHNPALLAGKHLVSSIVPLGCQQDLGSSGNVPAVKDGGHSGPEDGEVVFDRSKCPITFWKRINKGNFMHVRKICSATGMERVWDTTIVDLHHLFVHAAVSKPPSKCTGGQVNNGPR